MKELNALWNIIPTPNGTLGVQQSLEDRLIIRLSRLLAISPEDALFKQKKTLRVKLSGDGTRIGKRLHVTNFTFTILDEGPIAHTSEGNHILAIVKVPEKYELLKLALEDVCHDVERLNEIKLKSERFSIEYFLGGDLKFLAIAVGIDSACSKYACPWCKCSLDEHGDLKKKWSISDPNFGARTVEESISFSSLPKSRKKFNVSHPPSFLTVPFINVVVDNLHLFLRVADVLINHLIEELCRQDAIDKAKLFPHLSAVIIGISTTTRSLYPTLGIPSYNWCKICGKDF